MAKDQLDRMVEQIKEKIITSSAPTYPPNEQWQEVLTKNFKEILSNGDDIFGDIARKEAINRIIPNDALIPLKDVCIISGYSRQTIYKKTKNGQLPTTIRNRDNKTCVKGKDFKQWHNGEQSINNIIKK